MVRHGCDQNPTYFHKKMYEVYMIQLSMQLKFLFQSYRTPSNGAWMQVDNSYRFSILRRKKTGLIRSGARLPTFPYSPAPPRPTPLLFITKPQQNKPNKINQTKQTNQSTQRNKPTNQPNETNQPTNQQTKSTNHLHNKTNKTKQTNKSNNRTNKPNKHGRTPLYNTREKSLNFFLLLL